MAKVLVPLAEGCEEMEAVIIIDVLRRAGWDVLPAGIDRERITASRGVVLVADARLEDVDPAGIDVLAIPGGGAGAERLRTNAAVLRLVRDFEAQGKWVGAICAGPLVLQEAGILVNRRATCHPGVRSRFEGQAQPERVVIDGRVVTSQGPGTAFEFALALIRQIDGPAAADAVAEGLLLPGDD